MQLHKITWVLLIIGGLNWLLEVFNLGIGRFLPDWLALTVYLLVGLSAVYEIFYGTNRRGPAKSPSQAI